MALRSPISAKSLANNIVPFFFLLITEIILFSILCNTIFTIILSPKKSFLATFSMQKFHIWRGRQNKLSVLSNGRKRSKKSIEQNPDIYPFSIRCLYLLRNKKFLKCLFSRVYNRELNYIRSAPSSNFCGIRIKSFCIFNLKACDFLSSC